MHVGSNQVKFSPKKHARIHSFFHHASVMVAQKVMMEVKLGADALEFMNVTPCLFQKNREKHQKHEKLSL